MNVKTHHETQMNSDNLLIRGDSLAALTRLKQQWERSGTSQRVKMIYIDPPYNTGNTFAYRDALSQAEWDTMMHPRLELAREIMREDALIFISIDLNQLAQLKLLCDQIFGKKNLVANFVWVSNLKGRQLGAGPAGTHEYILAYARDISKIGKLRGSVKELNSLMPAVYSLPKYCVKHDERGAYVTKNELYNTNSRFNEVTSESLVYLIHYRPATGEVATTKLNEPSPGADWVTAWPHPNHRHGYKYHAWRWSAAKVERDYQELEFEVTTENRLIIRTKVRDFEQTTLKDLIMGPSTVTAQHELEKLGLGGIFETPKPTGLLKILIEAATQPGDLVLDFFAGSGAFGQAAAQSGRRFILVQLEEEFTKRHAAGASRLGLFTIADLTAARLQRCGISFRQETLNLTNPRVSREVVKPDFR